jgi:glycosyltransferase involved in cell wall biosynthesis
MEYMVMIKLAQEHTESASQTASPSCQSEVRKPDSPKLAVIVACYNYKSFVERAIRSVLDQGRDDCELVVVDDGSTDGSWEVISSTGATAFKIDNGGARRACLFGLDKTTAPFVLFLDADDELKPGALGSIIDRLDPRVAKLQFSLTRIDADGNTISRAFPSLETFRARETIARQVLKSGVYKSPPTSGNVFRRDLCELLREADYDKFVDGAILFVAPFLGDIVSVAEELGCYRIHGRNDSGLGQAPDGVSLQRDIDRFLARMEHLRAILRRLRPDLETVEPRDTFYYREHQLFLDIASGHRPRLIALPGLLVKLAGEPSSAKNRLALAAFFCLVSILPNKVRNTLLAYRLKTGHRSILGFAKEVVGGRVPLRT